MSTVFFKRLGLVMSLCLITALSYGQEKGDMAVGGNFAFAFDDFNNVGLNAKFQYNILDQLRFEPSMGYYFKKDHVDFWDINANVHYLFPITEQLNIYPLGGLTLIQGRVDVGDVDVTTTKFGVNLGGGIEYKITPQFALGAEMKYQLVSDIDRAVLSVGMTYRF